MRFNIFTLLLLTVLLSPAAVQAQRQAVQSQDRSPAPVALEQDNEVKSTVALLDLWLQGKLQNADWLMTEEDFAQMATELYGKAADSNLMSAFRQKQDELMELMTEVKAAKAGASLARAEQRSGDNNLRAIVSHIVFTSPDYNKTFRLILLRTPGGFRAAMLDS